MLKSWILIPCWQGTRIPCGCVLNHVLLDTAKREVQLFPSFPIYPNKHPYFLTNLHRSILLTWCLLICSLAPYHCISLTDWIKLSVPVTFCTGRTLWYAARAIRQVSIAGSQFPVMENHWSHEALWAFWGIWTVLIAHFSHSNRLYQTNDIFIFPSDSICLHLRWCKMSENKRNENVLWCIFASIWYSYVIVMRGEVSIQHFLSLWILFSVYV